MSLFRRFRADRAGNVTIMFAFSIVPIIVLVGMGADYSVAGRREAKLNAISDAAALSTTTPAMMIQPAAVAQANAVAMFNAQAATIPGVAWTILSAPQISVIDTPSATTTVRTTTVKYSAASQNAFASLLKINTMTIGGTSQASSYVSPNMDFYLLIDTSPSMGIAATTADINTMVSNTSAQGGCAFACHETNPSGGDVAGNPKDANNKVMDNYALARSLGVTLRIDLVTQAVSSLISTAANTESQNHSVYRIATNTFDYTYKTITALTANLTQAQSNAANIAMLQVYGGNNVTQTNNNSDEDTAYDAAMGNTTSIPNPGNGTNQLGDTPQEVLFIVTDGVIDELYNGGRKITTIGGTTDWCTPLKARGIRIAILYTTYNPLPTNSFYNNNVAPFQPTIGTAASKCASPGLYFQVNTDGDITAAMNTLFRKAVATAHLTQ